MYRDPYGKAITEFDLLHGMHGSVVELRPAELPSDVTGGPGSRKRMNEDGRGRRAVRIVISWCRTDVFLLVLLTLVALAIRLPYWRTIPRAGDEVGQAVYAYKISQGHGFPLVGNDAYAGPFFFYLLALLFRLGVSDPLVGRTIVLLSGALTAMATYAWVRRLPGRRVAALVAAGLVAINPHLILLSHLGGTTFLMPFLTTTFLWLLSSAVATDRPGYLLWAALVAGLAIQSNPVAALLVAGGLLWASWRVRTVTRLGRYWPFWPIIACLCVVFVYSPVIVHNLTSDLTSVQDAGLRSYLWQAEPTIHTFFVNSQRLALQLVRQVGGVLVGDETLVTILGWPLLYVAWASAGFVVTARKTSALPLFLILPFLIVFPYFSGHYGMVYPVRFTSLLTPVFAACMGFLVATVVDCIKSAEHSSIRRVAILCAVLAVLLVAIQPLALFRYYESIKAQDLSGRVLLSLCEEIVAENHGERVYVSSTHKMMRVAGIPYVPHSHFLLADIHQEFLAPAQIIGRLLEDSGSAMLLLDEESAAVVGRVAPLTPWPSAANAEAQQMGYGLYTLDAGAALVKPDHVLTGEEALAVEPKTAVGAVLGGGVELMGYDLPAGTVPGETLPLTVYWRTTASLSQGTYVGFVHLFDPAAALVAQDDHLLGGESYPLGAWQPDEVVVETYGLLVAEDAALGSYALRAGIYTWPDLDRLAVPGHADDIVELGTVEIAPKP